MKVILENQWLEDIGKSGYHAGVSMKGLIISVKVIYIFFASI
jgi:hypothetical protein